MTRKKIAVNTRLLLKDKLEGIGWFTFENLKRIVENHPEIDFIFLFDRAFSEEFIFGPNVQGVVIGPQARHPILFKIWFNFSVKRALKKYKIDLFLSPDGYLSLTTDVPSIAVIHDLNFEHYPEDLPSNVSKYYRKYFPKFARKAKRIATVSEYSKKDIHECYSIPLDKIDVVFNGVGTSFFPLEASEKTEVRNKYSSGSEYFVYIGSLHNRKNINRLFQAFEIFKKETNSNIKLVIIGEQMWKGGSWHETFENHAFNGDIIFTGRLFEKDLNNVLASALAMTFVPYFEGFGIPILEAFKCEIPVITSNVTSMPEVAGDAALLVDPFDVNQISQAMKKISKDEDLRKELIQKGSKRLQEFSWEKTSENLWKCMVKEL